jgi:hypothetical protein
MRLRGRGLLYAQQEVVMFWRRLLRGLYDIRDLMEHDVRVSYSYKLSDASTCPALLFAKISW